MDNYEIRKKKVYDFMCADFYKPMKIKELAIMLEVSAEDRPVLEQILLELQAEGKIELSKRGKYSPAKAEILEGIFTAHPKGFGFVRIEGMTEDVFIGPEKTAGAMHRDRVRVQVLPGRDGRRPEGTIVEILERGMKKLVATYQSAGNYGFAIPDNERFGHDLFIPGHASMHAPDGSKVVVEVTDYGSEGRSPEGRIIEVLGSIEDAGVDILSIVRAYDLPEDFPEKVISQVNRVAQPVSAADLCGREDLREWLTITIDGDDSKDFDDAVSLTRDGEDYILGVHIADVTNYVQENSALDREARERGTSVYLADRVIPMLPFALSNGICSLNEGEDRLTLSCIMRISSKGEITDHRIAEAVICSRHRMTYRKVQAILEEGDAGLLQEYADIVPMLREMAELSAKLRERRRLRGAIDFDFPEAKVVLNEQGRTKAIMACERNKATKLIEDFMLAANETVAEDYFWQDIPFVYRTHEKPDPEKIRALSTFIYNFGYRIHIGGKEIHPKELQKLLEQLEGSDEEAMLSRLTLRSMKQAKYTTECSGHFGLAARYYCHFTSPIRRYPDLQIHRIIKDALRGRMTEEKTIHYREILPETAKHSSERERLAEEAERETVKMKKVEFMEQHLGESYWGVISGVMEFGFFVELTNTVEGLIRVSQLTDDFYLYDENRYALVGEESGRTYSLGQRILVRVIGADKRKRTVDFEPA